MSAEPILLHPMGIIEMVRYSVRIYSQSFLLLIAIAASLYSIPLALLLLSFFWDSGTVVASLLSGLSDIVVFFVAITYVTAALTFVLSLQFVGLKASFLQILQRLRGTLAVQLLGTTFLASLVLMGMILLLTISGLILSLFVSDFAGRIIFFLLAFISVVVVFVFVICFALITPIIVLERRAYLSALRRSRDLAKGHLWRIFRAFLVPYSFLVLHLIITFALTFSLDPSASMSDPGRLYSTINIIISTLVGPVYSAYIVLLYYDIRVRKESLNIETVREAV